MTKMILVVMLTSLMIGIGWAGDVPQEKKTQFALTLSGLAVAPDTGDGRGSIGPGAMVHFDLGRSFVIAPEITAGLTGLYGGLTANFRAHRFFAGAGGGILYFYKESQEVQGDVMMKVQVGTRGPRWLFAAAFISNVFGGGWLNGIHLTIGRIF
jgi:hypothetical protein